MNVLSVIFFVFAVIGAIDYILNNRFKLGEEFKRGFALFGNMSLSMIGMLVLAPAIGSMMRPALDFIKSTLHIDPSVIPAALLANDMGGGTLAIELAADPEMGLFNGLIVSAMMGVIISFTVPFALGMVKKEQHGSLLLGLLCGVVAVPFGCLVAGFMCRISFGALLLDLLPLVLLSALIAVGLLLRPSLCVKIFRALGFLVKIVVTVGLLLGAVEYLFDVTVIPGLAPIEEGALTCFRISLTLCGVFPLVHLLSRVLGRPLRALGNRIGINEIAVMGLVANLASNATVFGTMHEMDDRGAVLNSAFAASAAFVFGSHLAFTQSINSAYVVPMIVAKFVSGALALVLAYIVYERMGKKKGGAA